MSNRPTRFSGYASRHAPSAIRARPRAASSSWLALPEGFDTQAMLLQAARSGVTYVPGRAFFHDGGGANLLRLRYSATPQDRIAEGVHRLIRTIRAWL